MATVQLVDVSALGWQQVVRVEADYRQLVRVDYRLKLAVAALDWHQLARLETDYRQQLVRVVADYRQQLWILIVLRSPYSLHPSSTSTRLLQVIDSPPLPAPALAMGPCSLDPESRHPLHHWLAGSRKE